MKRLAIIVASLALTCSPAHAKPYHGNRGVIASDQPNSYLTCPGNGEVCVWHNGPPPLTIHVPPGVTEIIIQTVPIGPGLPNQFCTDSQGNIVDDAVCENERRPLQAPKK